MNVMFRSFLDDDGGLTVDLSKAMDNGGGALFESSKSPVHLLLSIGKDQGIWFGFVY